MAKSVYTKMEDSNIRSALRILLFEDKQAENNDVTYNQLIERHLSAPMNRKTPAKLESLGNYMQINEENVKKTIRGLFWVHQVVLMVFIHDI